MSSKQFSQEQKLAIVTNAATIGFKQAAEIAGVHYTTVYDWQRDLKSLGQEAFLAYQPSYPGRGIKVISPEKETAVLDCWKSNPGFGPGQLRGKLRRQGITISIRSIRKIMKANGYAATGEKSDKAKPQRFEARRPLELAQMDILEFFINKAKAYIILLLDDFSRFILGWRLLDQTSVDAVIGVVADAVNRYGKMEEILTDRGFVFYSWRGINRFETYLETERIDQTHARPHHPQTLGKVEACNRRIKRELIDQKRFSNLHEAQDAVEGWVEHYKYVPYCLIKLCY
jgi:transposase